MTPTENAVREIVNPIARDLELSVYDIELAGGSLRVLLDKDGGIDIGSITEATRRISRALDDSDPISGSYTLEVSSPGIERTLRTPDHFASALGARVKVKTKPDSGLERRFGGVLESFADPVATIRTDSDEAIDVSIAQIERVRTEFVDQASPKPGGAKSKQGPKAPHKNDTVTETPDGGGSADGSSQQNTTTRGTSS